MIKNNFIIKFVQEVKVEARRVIWPTRKEIIVTSIMVFIMVFLASIFFLAADKLFTWGINILLSI